MSDVTKQTFEEWHKEMISYAKEVQGDNYAGDDYYTQSDCWKKHYEDGLTPKDAVDSDMGYWDD